MSSGKVIDRYKAEHLFLLVGRNPLPNYISAKLLIKQDAKVYFVYSEKTGDSTGTEAYKKRLVDKLKVQLGKDFFTPVDVPVINPSDSTCIRSAIENQFKSIPKDANIGVNYTGGTKAMSVHTYRALEEFGKKKNSQLRFSYLDPRELKLCFDGESDGFELGNPGKGKEFFAISKINLLDLLFLHGLKPLKRSNHNFRQEVRFEKVVNALFEERFSTSDWNKLSSKIGALLSKNEKDRFEYKPPKQHNQEKYEEHLRKQIIPLPSDMPKFRQALAEYGLLQGDEIVLGKLDTSESAEGFCKFLRSDWFEDFVFSKVKQVSDDAHLENTALSLEISLPDDEEEPFFEIDVVAMRGYQLFALSCTTDTDIKMCKSKLFEVVHRAKQLGGDETRIGLVCRAEANTVNTLERQLEEDQVVVFGKDDLAKLDTKLGKWFKGE